MTSAHDFWPAWQLGRSPLESTCNRLPSLCICSSPSGTVPIGGGAEVPVVADGRGEPGETDSQRSTAPPSEAGSLQQEEEQPDVRVPGRRRACSVADSLPNSPSALLH